MKTLLALIVALAALPAQAKDMQKYLNDTQKMVGQGKHQEALERFIWFHQHALEHEPAMSGVRLSFALSYWKSLGDVYPPAKKALVETRDRTAKQVSENGGTFELFHDAASLNRTLGEESKTVELFQTLDAQHPGLAKRYWHVAKNPVIAAKHYDLARKYMGDFAGQFQHVTEMYEQHKKFYDNPKIGGTHLKKFNENHFVEESVQLITVALALGERKAALDIQKKALAVMDDSRLRDAVPVEAEKGS